MVKANCYVSVSEVLRSFPEQLVQDSVVSDKVDITTSLCILQVRTVCAPGWPENPFLQHSGDHWLSKSYIGET